MSRGFVFIVSMMLASAGLCCAAGKTQSPPRFRGWQGIRVIEQPGWPRVMRAADLNGDGRQELIVVNTRQSRLDVYRWLPPAARKSPVAASDDRPNELPMAEDFKRIEIPQERLPRDVLAKDLNGDGKLELIVLQTPPNRIAVYSRNANRQWNKTRTWDLLPGTLSGRDVLMRIVGTKGQKDESKKGKKGTNAVTLLISMNQGIQQLTLSEGSRAKWMEPRGHGGRVDWWQADVDGDGDLDLVEWDRAEKQPVRWYEQVNGRLMPAVGLNKERVDDVQVMAGEKQAELLLLGGVQNGILRRYRMVKSKVTPLGLRQPLPLRGADKAAWTGIMLDGKPALVAVDPNQPRLTVAMLGDSGWTEGDSYPIVSNVRAMVAPQGRPGTLLLWAKDAGDLHVSDWKNGRFTYPRPLKMTKVEDRKILALGHAGHTVWWVQKVGKDLDMYVWPGDAKKARLTRFKGAGGKADKVAWLGGTKLLVQDQYARNPKLVEMIDGKTVISQPAHLKKAKLDQFMLVPVKDGKLRPAKLADGVLQWLDDDLQPTDQVMLPDGLRLIGYVENADGSAWVLQAGGEKIHLLKPDNSGVMRLADSYDLTSGLNLVRDPVLGLMLIDAQMLERLSQGRGHELKLVETIDSREGRPNGVKEATIHRIFTTNVLGDHSEDLILADDRRHQLTVLTHEKNKVKLKVVISWPVYADRAYPYGGGPGDQLTHEPRTVVGLDVDGDGVQDLAMLCQDRLLIYLGRDAGRQTQTQTQTHVKSQTKSQTKGGK